MQVEKKALTTRCRGAVKQLVNLLFVSIAQEHQLRPLKHRGHIVCNACTSFKGT
jgi:hypothetical protein